LEFKVCIFDREKVAVIYRLDSGLRLHAMIVNGREVKPERRLKADRKKLFKLIASLLDTGHEIHPFLDNLKAE